MLSSSWYGHDSYTVVQLGRHDSFPQGSGSLLAADELGHRYDINSFPGKQVVLPVQVLFKIIPKQCVIKLSRNSSLYNFENTLCITTGTQKKIDFRGTSHNVHSADGI